MKFLLIFLFAKTSYAFLVIPPDGILPNTMEITTKKTGDQDKGLTHLPFKIKRSKVSRLDNRIIDDFDNNIDSIPLKPQTVPGPIKVSFKNAADLKTSSDELTLADMIEHRSVIENVNFYTYVVSILEKDKFLSAGALIKDDWVLTAADSLYFKQDRSRFLRVRLGSTNYKKRGVIAPVKFIEIHPLFDDTTPEYDIALVKLARTVRKTHTISSIRIQKAQVDITTTHFILTSWQSMSSISRALKKTQHANEPIEPIDLTHRACLLKMTHIHPMVESECKTYLGNMNINSTENLMCLESDTPCLREIGAPVVLDRVLWGVVSSYVDADCNKTTPAPPILVTKTSSSKIYTWIKAITNNELWKGGGENVDADSGMDFDYNERVFD